MCLTFRRYFYRRSYTVEAPQNNWWSTFGASERMRLRSDQTSVDQSSLDQRVNFVPVQGGKPAGGKGKFKFPKFWGGQRGQPSAPSTTDGPPQPKEEEPPQKHQTLPAKVTQTFDQMLKSHSFCEASQQLIDREERLFGVTLEAEAVGPHQEELEKLSADYKHLEDLVLQVLRLSLTPEMANMDTLRSAVQAIYQEMEQDKRWKRSSQTPPAWRPCGWKKLHDATLRGLVEERMDAPTTPTGDQVQQSSVRTDITSMGKQLKEDLLWVVKEVNKCYPSEHNICNFYAGLYHQNLAVRLRKITEFVLDDEDCAFLLRWVNEYYPDILKKPELIREIDTEELGKLLPKESLEPLEEQYLSKQQDELTTYISRVLEEEKKKWDGSEEPPREDGCFVSPVAYDIIQLINGRVTAAERIVGDRQKAQCITGTLKDLMQKFVSFQNDIMRQNKPNSRPFIKANLGCIRQFTDVLQQKSHLFTEDVQKNCVLVLAEMKQSAHAYLLKPVHDTLKPHYRKLGTNDWLNKPLFEKLLDSLLKEIQDLQGSTEPAHQDLIGQLHREVTTEYVRRLLKGDVKLKDKERQLKACQAVTDNAESLHDLFNKMGSKEDWLKEILTKIAEVLKLQDLPAVQMQVVSLGTAFPDLSEKHVSALLKLKTNFSKGNRKTVKETLTETLRETGSSAATRSFFSTIQI